ncbi:MAG: hypothetical protein J4F36_13500 [Nitrosopumilaceae archaeon]|nr:hypothetical protein [Nitrosopumilaceae archaeon]
MPDFTSGGIDVDVINPLRINQITFEQFEIEDEDEDKNNSVMVTVDYPTSYDLDCNVTQKFANTNATYTNMTGQPIGTNLSQSYFMMYRAIVQPMKSVMMISHYWICLMTLETVPMEPKDNLVILT